MPRVRFEPTTTVFKREKTVHALDHAATVISFVLVLVEKIADVQTSRSLLWLAPHVRGYQYFNKFSLARHVYAFTPLTSEQELL
jgi:hypothetical protein